jgi:hypothetical protein
VIAAIAFSPGNCSVVTAASDLAAVPGLPAEMTGYARVETRRRLMGAILLDRVLRLVRTAFW